jgi:chorismate synthase
VITGVPAGVGDPVFDKLDALLGQALFSIGAVKGVEIGAGFSVVESKGLDNNDSFLSQSETSSNMDNKNAPDANTEVPDAIKETNNSGGILGGISDGDDIIIRAAFKPTPSISAEQQTVNKDGKPVTISVKGRHDPIIVSRAVVVVEAMANIVLADRLLVGMSAKLDRIKDFYKK